MAIGAVLWDFGGVFTTSPFEAFNRFEVARGLPKDFIRTVNAANPLENAWARLERAEIDRAGFDREFLEESAALGHPVRGAEVLPLLAGEVRPRMVQALRLCKTRFKVGCITNNMAPAAGPGPAAPAARGAEIMGLFDVIVESSKAGVRKPDPRIYVIACDELGVAPETCVYLDDLGINCKAAASLGMAAIKVVSEAQALNDLARATGLVFPEVQAA